MTQNHVSGMEASAVSVLKRAVELDQGGRFQESLVCYQEGIQLLIDVLKGPPSPSYKSVPTGTGRQIIEPCSICPFSCVTSCER